MEYDYLDALRYAVDYNIHCLGKWNTKEENKMERYEFMKRQLRQLFFGNDPLNFIQDATVEYGDQETFCIVRLKVPRITEGFNYYNSQRFNIEPVSVTLRRLMDEHINSAIMSPAEVEAVIQKAPEGAPPKPIKPEEKKPTPVEPMMPERVVYSGPKTIVFWPDGTKTMVSLMEGQEHDEYGAFCAAFLKKMFGATHKAKKFLNSIKVVQEPKAKKQKTEERPTEEAVCDDE